MAPRGEFEVTYWGGPDNPKPCGGVNYSVPYTSLPSNDLAPGSVNTQSINGFLTSSPWVAGSPFSTVFSGTEWVMGIFEVVGGGASGLVTAGASNFSIALIVTNVAVYTGPAGSINYTATLSRSALTLVHTWVGADLNTLYLFPGQAVTFIQSGTVVYFTGLMLTGIYGYGQGLSVPPFAKVTSYVAGRYIAELSGRLVVAECLFPGGGGTGTAVLPTIAWSGVGIFGQAWDGTAGHDVWNPANQAFFNGNIGGFNLLSDVPDQITGMGTVGQSIILVRQNGITQQDPNSTFSTSGLQPFNWYHMWSSAQGVGGITGTVAQFGQMLTFRSIDNIYTLSMSSGLTPLGEKIIARVNADQSLIENSPAVITSGNGFWNFASIYNLDGELHYLLTLSSITTDQSATPTNLFTSCFAYDLNLHDGSWHVWDFSKYFTSSGAGSGFVGFSCPLLALKPCFIQAGAGALIDTQTSNRYFMAGTFSAYAKNVPSALTLTGILSQFIPFDYDFSTNPITPYITALYPAAAYPSTTITFRGEVLSLGHKLSNRRLRILADNSPVSTGVQQQAQATFTGETSNASSPTVNMQGNAAPTGAPIQTYYFDATLSDLSIQPSLTSVFSTATPWQTLCAFRIASASLIGIDATSTTQ